MNEAESARRVYDNWRSVRDDVHQAAIDCNRDPDQITIIGVSKYVDAATTTALTQAGCCDLGESRPQNLWQKAESMETEATVRWHLIGHLQRNKIRRLLRHQPLIHSIDSQRLLRSVADESCSQSLVTQVFLEVNISGDEAKTGFAPSELIEVIDDRPSEGVRLRGLMAMAGWGTDANEARRQFEKTRELRDELEQKTGVSLPDLSMGMSGDFREAIASGATMLRIGSRLFEGVMDR